MSACTFTVETLESYFGCSVFVRPMLCWSKGREIVARCVVAQERKGDITRLQAADSSARDKLFSMI